MINNKQLAIPRPCHTVSYLTEDNKPTACFAKLLHLVSIKGGFMVNLWAILQLNLCTIKYMYV